MGIAVAELDLNVWVGCLACYNEGKLVGEWFPAAECPTERDEFDAAVKTPGSHDALHEELWVMDHEGFPEGVGEFSPMQAQEYAEWMSKLDESDHEAFLAYVNHVGDFDWQSVEKFQEAYQGVYTSDEDFAMEMAESIGAIDPDATWPNNYIDWERAARDLMMDYFEEDGHYFRA